MMERGEKFFDSIANERLKLVCVCVCVCVCACVRAFLCSCGCACVSLSLSLSLSFSLPQNRFRKTFTEKNLVMKDLEKTF